MSKFSFKDAKAAALAASTGAEVDAVEAQVAANVHQIYSEVKTAGHAAAWARIWCNGIFGRDPLDTIKTGVVTQEKWNMN